MTRNLSLREFAKRERANSWQSKGKFAFKFIDCHAVFIKTAHNDEQKAFFIAQWRRGLCHIELSHKAKIHIITASEVRNTKQPNSLQGTATAKTLTHFHQLARRKSKIHFCHFERSALAQSEKSKEFKIRFKSANSHFKFMDTSLRSVWQEILQVTLSYWVFCKKAKYPLAMTAHPCHFERRA